MRKFGDKIKVAIFVIICLAGLLYLTISTGKLHLKEEGYNIYVAFEDVAGLEKNSMVMFNGLEVGRVQDMDISYRKGRTKIILKLLIRKDIKIWDDSLVSIKTLGLMGEKFVHIASSEGKEFINPGAILAGKPFTDMDVLMNEALNISEEIEGLVTNITGLTGEVQKLSANFNYTLQDNQDEISRIIKNLEATSKNFEEFSADLKSHPWKILWKTKEKESKKKGK